MENKQRDNFVFFRSFFEAIDEVDTDTQLSLYRAIAVYALNGETPNLSGAAKAIFLMAKPIIDKTMRSMITGKNERTKEAHPKGIRTQKNNQIQLKTTKKQLKTTRM